MKKMFVLSALVFSFNARAHNHDTKPVSPNTSCPEHATVTEEEVKNAKKAWGKALVAIGSEYEANGWEAARQKAKSIIDSAYGYQNEGVLFKPTLTEGDQTFRNTAEGALAYFVGGDDNYPKDSGFALKGWREVHFSTAGINIYGPKATTMSKVTLIDNKGNSTTVDKTLVFKKDSKGSLRIVVHHSSLPYASDKLM